MCGIVFAIQLFSSPKLHCDYRGTLKLSNFTEEYFLGKASAKQYDGERDTERASVDESKLMIA